MNIQKIISVIVPIYNIAKYLDKCICSICNQTYENLQIILVNDGSTDDSGEICDKYAKQDKRIQVIHKSNEGLVSARKAGLKMAKGEYVSYVDGDDWIEPDMYEFMIKEMLDKSVDLVEVDSFMDMGNESILMKNSIPYGKNRVEDIIPIMLSDALFNVCSLKVYVWSKLFKKDLLEKVQYQVDDNVRVGEDAAVTYPYILQCQCISVVEYAGYHYVQRQGSMVYSKDINEKEKMVTLIKQLWKCFSQNSKADILKWQLNQYAKLLFLSRNISYFDKDENERILLPYGGISRNESVIVYGAGRVGQSVYNYLRGIKSVNIECWLDREYYKYQQMGFDVRMPEIILKKQYRNAKIIIAVNNQNAVKNIFIWLVENGIHKDKILFLKKEFLDEDFLVKDLDL